MDVVVASDSSLGCKSSVSNIRNGKFNEEIRKPPKGLAIRENQIELREKKMDSGARMASPQQGFQTTLLFLSRLSL